jgi:hypothetical protein
MTHVRLTHPTRDTLEFRTAQQDEDQREAVANQTAELGTDRPTLVHTETVENTRTIRGSVTGLRRARNDPSTSDPRQALASYADELHAHVDEFQGEGYTLVDDQLDLSKRGVIEAVEWSVTPGRVYELDYEATVKIGRGTFEDRQIQRRNPTFDAGMDVWARVDGNDLPGMRDYRAEKTVGIEVNAVFDRGNAENNDAVFQEGTTLTVSYEGVHSGTLAQRRQADADLAALAGTKENVDFETKFPGYTLSGFVTNYDSELEQQQAGNAHRYRLTFVVGERA